MAVLGLLVQAAGDLDEWPRYCRFGTAEHTKDLGHLARPATRPLGFAWDRVALEWEEPVCAEKAEWEEEEDVAPALLFRGTMLYFGDEGRHRPIDWHQGLRLLVARHPGCELDWDNGHAENLSTWSDGILGDDGRF